MAQNSDPLETDEEVNELMRTDPLSLTDDDVDKIASRLRKARHSFAQQELKKQQSGSSGGSKNQGKRSGKGVSINDLDLEL